MHSIKTRLFLILLSANALLALLTYAVVSWSFDRGFLDYINRAEQQRLVPLVQALAEGYGEHGDWHWVSRDRRQWRQLMYRFLLTRPEPRPPRGLDRLEPPPMVFDPRLTLLDADKNVIIGRRGRATAILKPITREDRVIGFLAIAPRRELVESVERVFASQQNRNFAIIAAGMVLMSGLLAIGIAAWLTRPIKALAAGTQQLTRGQFDHRIDVRGRHELAQLAKDFNSLAINLAANQKSRRQWIADIAHELRTPLTVLRGEIEAILDEVRALSIDNIKSLANETRQLTRLVDDLYELSLSDLGALEYRKQPLDLSASLKEVFEAHAQALEQAGLHLNFTPVGNATINADPQRLAQLWNNLLQNSLRYTDAPGELQVEISLSNQAVTLTWQDSSPGVAATDMKRLTERLFRVDSARNRGAGGSGLGLAIAAAVVDAHGGTLRAFRAEPGGLGWEIVLPR